MIGRLDRGFMQFYRNARRITRLAVALLPLMALLVGSCKTAEQPQAYNGSIGPEQFRGVLFPDRAGFQGANYSPAAGYVSAARGFVEDTPPALMMLTRQEIGYLYGRPALQRQDADAEVWQYKTGACVVDFYFYGPDKLSYIDVRLKEDDMTFRAIPASARERSGCLHDVDAEDFPATST
jgi:hypothetical protein